MRYATWKIDFSDSELEGSGPESSITTGKMEGGASISPFFILGYLSSEADISDLQKWHVTEITQAEALDLALTINPECYLTDDGYISSP